MRGGQRRNRARRFFLEVNDGGWFSVRGAVLVSQSDLLRLVMLRLSRSGYDVSTLLAE